MCPRWTLCWPFCVSFHSDPGALLARIEFFLFFSLPNTIVLLQSNDRNPRRWHLYYLRPACQTPRTCLPLLPRPGFVLEDRAEDDTLTIFVPLSQAPTREPRSVCPCFLTLYISPLLVPSSLLSPLPAPSRTLTPNDNANRVHARLFDRSNGMASKD